MVKEKEKEVVVKPKKVRAKRVKKEEASKVSPPTPRTTRRLSRSVSLSLTDLFIPFVRLL